MKLQEYKGRKVVTLEVIEMYVTSNEEAVVEHVKSGFYRWLKNKAVKLSMTEAREYGQKKNFNYSRGIMLFDIQDVFNAIADNGKYLAGDFDFTAFAQDIGREEVRALPEEIANKDWRRGKKDAKPEAKPIIKKHIMTVDKTNTKSTVTPMLTSQMKIEDPEPVQTTVSIDEVYAMLDTQAELHAAEIAQMKEQVNFLIKTSTVVLDKMQEVLNKLNETKQTETSEPETKTETEPSILILKEDATFKEWGKIVDNAVALILKVKPDWTKSSVLSSAYDRLRAQYGIVWEQEAKEFKEAMGRGPISTRELCWWIESNKKNYKNLLIGKLNTIYSEAKRQAAKGA